MDLVNIFRPAYENQGDNIILNFYKPKEGIYIKINNDASKDWLIVNKDTDSSRLFEWFKCADYYSNIINTQKAVDFKKKIHSNNYLTIFIKKDNVFGKDKNKSLPSEEIKERMIEYYKTLENPGLRVRDRKFKELLSSIPTKIDTENLNRCRQYLLDNIEELLKGISDQQDDFQKYIKIFFDADIQEYKREHDRYLIPRIFNKNDFNINIDGRVLGLSNHNITMNYKKPFLQLNGMKCQVPYRLAVSEAMVHNKFFDWLKYQPTRTGYIPIDFTFQQPMKKYNELSKGAYYYLSTTIEKDEIIVTDFEYIPSFGQTINIEVKDYLSTRLVSYEEKSILSTERFETLKELEKAIDSRYFEGKLIKSYYSKGKSKEISNRIFNLLLLNKKAFYDFFRKNNPKAIKAIISNISLDIIKEHIKNGDCIRARQVYHLMTALIKYFGGSIEMAGQLRELVAIISSKIKSGRQVDCDSDEEFYFLSGQIISFILSKNKGSKKNLYLIEPFLNLQNGEILKKRILYLFNCYKYAISTKDYCFKIALSMVLTYKANVNIKELESIFLAGLLSNNILYEIYKKEEKLEYDAK